MDLRGNIYGLLAAHPLAPLVSLHHLDSVVPIIPGRTQHDALQSILGAARSDPSRILQQTFCYDRHRNWSVSVSWGYTAQIYTRILTPKDLSTPLRTFRTWRTYHEGPFTFNTRALPKDPCDRPLVYFVDRVHDLGKGGTRSSYLREKNETELRKECARSEYVAALKIETVAVSSPKMRRDEWRKVRPCRNYVLLSASKSLYRPQFFPHKIEWFSTLEKKRKEKKVIFYYLVFFTLLTLFCLFSSYFDI